MAGSPKPVEAFLYGAAWASIRRQMDLHQRLLETVRDILPALLASHCHYCVARGDLLVIFVDSAVWGSQLRFYGPSLLDHLSKSAGRCFRQFQIRSLLPTSPPAVRKTDLVLPGPSVTARLREIAENSPEGEIREALLRLCGTLQNLAGSKS